MEDITNNLEQLGFSSYEARAYVALLRQSPQNGYELARSSGIPRANIYAVLGKLKERGAVLAVDAPSGVRYAPLPVAELIQRQEHHFEELLQTTYRSLASLAREPSYDYVWNLQGYRVMLEHVRAVLEQSQKQVLIALWPTESEALEKTLQEVQARGVQITTLCVKPCPPETCGHCHGSIYRYASMPAPRNRWLQLVSDDTEMVASEIGEGEQALTIRTRQPLFIELARWNLNNSIALATVLEDLGERLPGLLKPETNELLSSLALSGSTQDQVEGKLISDPAADQ
jgi:hypothetical protein